MIFFLFRRIENYLHQTIPKLVIFFNKFKHHHPWWNSEYTTHGFPFILKEERGKSINFWEDIRKWGISEITNPPLVYGYCLKKSLLQLCSILLLLIVDVFIWSRLADNASPCPHLSIKLPILLLFSFFWWLWTCDASILYPIFFNNYNY